MPPFGLRSPKGGICLASGVSPWLIDGPVLSEAEEAPSCLATRPRLGSEPEVQ